MRQSHRPFLFVATIIKVGTVGGEGEGRGAVCVSSSYPLLSASLKRHMNIKIKHAKHEKHVKTWEKKEKKVGNQYWVSVP